VWVTAGKLTSTQESTILTAATTKITNLVNATPPAPHTVHPTAAWWHGHHHHHHR
jgi:hypothetical protein